MKRWLLRFVMRHLWNSVIPEDLESAYKGMSHGKKEGFRLQAQDFEKMELWSFLHDEMMKVALKRLYTASSKDDLIFGQACIWMEEVRQLKVKKLAK